MAGRSIRLFLVDGSPQGLRTAEVGNWTGLAVVCPRTDLAKLGARPEVRRTGVYILIGPSETTSANAVYVGEGDEVWERLTSHDNGKDFWTWVVVFVSKDDNLTKAHVRWLESTLVREIRRANRVEVVNGNEPPSGRLPEADLADMTGFFENVRLLLPTLGADVFAVEALPGVAAVDENELALELRWEDARATCLVRDGQFVVQPGSTARVTEVDSLGEGPRALRKRLRENGVLVPEPNAALLRFAQEYAFDSPSMAAAAVTGTGLNGRAHWKVRGSAQSYKDWLDHQVGAVA